MSLTNPIINRDLAAAHEPAPADFLKKAYMTREVLFAGDLQEDPAVFDFRFWRSYRLLHFLARVCYVVMTGLKKATTALPNREAPRLQDTKATKATRLPAD